MLFDWYCGATYLKIKKLILNKINNFNNLETIEIEGPGKTVQGNKILVYQRCIVRNPRLRVIDRAMLFANRCGGEYNFCIVRIKVLEDKSISLFTLFRFLYFMAEKK